MNLREKQLRQIVIQKNRNRVRAIPQYEESLLFEELTGKKIIPYIQNKLETQGKFSWADFGSGNRFAIKEAKYTINNPNFETYSVDLLEPDSISETIRKWNQFNLFWQNLSLNNMDLETAIKTISNKEYSPIHFQEDITQVKIPEKVDLITSVWILPYIPKPNQLIKNINKNLNKNGIYLFNSELTQNKTKKRFFENIKKQKKFDFKEDKENRLIYVKYTK